MIGRPIIAEGLVHLAVEEGGRLVVVDQTGRRWPVGTAYDRRPPRGTTEAGTITQCDVRHAFRPGLFEVRPDLAPLRPGEFDLDRRRTSPLRPTPREGEGEADGR